MESLSIIFTVLAIIVGLLPPIAIIALIVLLVRKNNPNEGNKFSVQKTFSFKNLLKTYLYMIISLAMFIGLFGFSMVGKAALGMISFNFSYGYDMAYEDYTKPLTPLEDPYIIGRDQEYKCYDTDKELTELDGKYYCHNSSELQMDLINGIAIIASMSFIMAMHLFLLWRTEQGQPSNNLRKFFIFGNLLVYSVMSLILIPTATYQTFYYILLAEKPVYGYSAPGGILSLAIFSLIIWTIWLITMLRTKDQAQQPEKVV